MHIGGAKRIVCPHRPPLPSRSPLFTSVLKHLRAFGLRGLFRRAILDQLDAEQETFSAHVTDQGMLLLEFLKSGKEITAKPQSVFLKLLLLDYLQHSFADGGRNGIPAEGIKVNPLGQHASDLWGSDDRRQRKPVADPLCHRHDIRNNPLRFEAPKVAAGAAKTGLDFVGYADATGRADVSINPLEIAVRKDNTSANALDGFGDEAGDPAGRGEVDELLDVRREFPARFSIVAPVRAAIRIRREGMMNAKTVRHIELPAYCEPSRTIRRRFLRDRRCAAR